MSKAFLFKKKNIILNCYQSNISYTMFDNTNDPLNASHETKISSYNPAWYKQNRESRLNTQKRYNDQNRERRIVYQRNRYQMLAEIKRLCAIDV